MRKLYFLLFILLSPSLQAGMLKDYCDQKNGQMYKWYKCPNSKLNLRITTCEYKNNYGEVEFVNGCSGPTGKYKKIFFSSCLKHDLCYHHEPITNGHSQKYCDMQFYENLEQACKKDAIDVKSCVNRAKFLYYGLRVIGKPAYYCENKFGRY